MTKYPIIPYQDPIQSIIDREHEQRFYSFETSPLCAIRQYTQQVDEILSENGLCFSDLSPMTRMSILINMNFIYETGASEPKRYQYFKYGDYLKEHLGTGERPEPVLPPIHD